MSDASRQITAIVRRLRRLADIGALAPLLDDISGEVVRDVRPYPPERAGQQYVRTGRLGRGWRRLPIKRSGRSLVGGVENVTLYAPYVVGVGQSKVFAGRWRTTRQMAAANRPLVYRRVKAALWRRWRQA